MGKQSKKEEAVANLSGAYALNALDADERALFEQLMAKSETLRAEVTEFGDTAVLLGQAIPPVEPPESLRIRLMAQIHNTPQVTAAEATEAAPVRPRWQRARRFALAGAFTALVLAGGGYAIGQGVQTQQPAVSLASSVDRIQVAGDHQTATLATARGKLRVIWSDSVGQAAIRNRDVLRLPSDSTYQLWIKDSAGKTVSAGFVSNNPDTWSVFKGDIKRGDTLMMTIEPAGGSPQATSDPLFAVEV